MKCENCKNEPDCKECEKEAFKRLSVLGKAKCSGYEPKTMPDDKLTDVTDNNVGKISDSEIIKALDICSKSTNGCSHRKYTCKDCYLNGQPMCSAILLQDAIDLFDRLQAENERLAKGWKADVILTANVKAEAYKECIEKVIETAFLIEENAFQGCYVISKGNLDNLLKKLVGEK